MRPYYSSWRFGASFPSRGPGCVTGLVGFVDEVIMGHVSTEYVCFPYQFLLLRPLHTYLPFEAGTVGPLMAGEASGLIAPHDLKRRPV
jgi:hypothetical protein